MKTDEEVRHEFQEFTRIEKFLGQFVKIRAIRAKKIPPFVFIRGLTISIAERDG
jgi:hypothetical protein